MYITSLTSPGLWELQEGSLRTKTKVSSLITISQVICIEYKDHIHIPKSEPYETFLIALFNLLTTFLRSSIVLLVATWGSF